MLNDKNSSKDKRTQEGSTYSAMLKYNIEIKMKLFLFEYLMLIELLKITILKYNTKQKKVESK